VSETEKTNVKALLGELKTAMENPNTTKEDLTTATDKLQKAVMECGRTEYQAAAAANSAGSQQKPADGAAGEQKKEEPKAEKPKKE